ncbi:MAG TPA: lipopolysaccharide heptosyltransferase II [Burkholderiaceae bacterium]|nr:lipopolysaccharide heptosyltransferase II [Burkholderiaceae bacterium]
MGSCLVVSPNWIGDAVMAQPLLQLLRQREPQARICVLAPPWVAPVWRAVAEVDEVIEARLAHGKLQLRERHVLARQLRDRRFDTAYVLPNSLKSALVPWMAGIPRRIGYRGEMRYGLINVVHHDDKHARRPMLPFYAALAHPPAREVPAVPLPRPRLHVDTARIAEASQRLGISAERPWVVFAPGAEFGPAKRWPAEYFAGLALRVIATDPTLQVLLLGSPKDREVAEVIATQVPGVRNFAGQTALDDAILLIAGAKAMATNDSGLMHIAAGFDRPQVALYGPTDPRHTPPSSPAAKVLWLHIECSPCQQRVCPLGHHRCMRELSVEMAWGSMRDMLRAPELQVGD